MNIKAEEKGSRANQIILFSLKVIFAALLFWSYFQFPALDKTAPWVAQIRSGLQTFLVPSIMFSIVRFTFILVYNARNSDRLVRGNFVLGVNRLTVVANVLCAALALMIICGINPLEFITSMTIVVMAIAVTFRDYITNMISGLIIMFSDELSVGDRVKFGDHQGRIMDITLAHIVFQDEDDDIVMVPNNSVFTMTLVNLSAHRSSLFSVKFELPLSMAVDIELLEEDLRESLGAHPNLDHDEDIEIRVLEIGKDFVRYRIDLHAVSYSNKLHRRLENEVLKEVLKFEKKEKESQ